MSSLKNTRVITLEGFPGTLDPILSMLQSMRGVAIIPKSSDTRGNDMSHGIVSCSRDILMATKHIKKCLGFVDVIIVPHYFDVPIIRDHADFTYARSFISRQLQCIRRALGVDHIPFEHVHINIPYEYIYEILLSNMSCRTLGTGDFSMYTKHIQYSPITGTVDVIPGGFDTESMKKEIIRKIFQK